MLRCLSQHAESLMNQKGILQNYRQERFPLFTDGSLRVTMSLLYSSIGVMDSDGLLWHDDVLCDDLMV